MTSCGLLKRQEEEEGEEQFLFEEAGAAWLHPNPWPFSLTQNHTDISISTSISINFIFMDRPMDSCDSMLSFRVIFLVPCIVVLAWEMKEEIKWMWDTIQNKKDTQD